MVVALALALLVSGAWRVGPTYDEHYYVASGYSYWQTRDFGLNREHPPLTKLLTALPLLFAPDVRWGDEAMRYVVYPQTWFYQVNGEHWQRNLFLARLPLCLATAALLWLVYRAAARFSSPRAGFFALAALAFNPNMLAHGRLAALDGGLTVFLFLAVLTWSELLGGFTWRRVLAAGVTFGLANLAKFTSLVLGPFYLLLGVGAAIARRSLAPLLHTGLVFLVGLGTFAVGYGFEARSVAEVWGLGSYAGEPRKAELAERTLVPEEVPAQLASTVRASGAGPEAAGRVASARDAEAAVDEALRLLDGTARERAGALAAFAAFDAGSGDLRKRAFAGVLEVPRSDDEVRPALVALSGLELEGEDSWRRWWEVARDQDWDREVFSQGWIRALTRGLFGDERPIPLLSAWKGIDYQLRHAAGGHGSYFRGQALPGKKAFEGGNPFPEYYLWVMGVKNPLAFVLLALVGLGAALRTRGAWTVPRLVAFVGFPLALFAMFSFGNALMGVKYVLPVFPFVALWIARGVETFPRVGAALAVVAVVEGAVLLPEPEATHPRELVYYNALAGGPVDGPWITVVGDDWGQDVPEVGAFHARYREELEAAGGLWYDAYTRADVALFGLERTRRVTGHPRGIVAVHAVDYYRSSRKYEWLRRYEPFARLGYTVYLFDTRGAPPGGDPREAWDAARGD